MILLRDALGAYSDTDKHTGWVQHNEVEDIDSFVETVSSSLEGDENAPKPRMYEVLEVEVIRRVRVGRRVVSTVEVDVEEEGV